VAAEHIGVEVACAEASRQSVVAIEVPAGCTAAEAVERSGIFALHPGLDPAACRLGIFGHEVDDDRVLAAGERVEVLRPLPEDPKERRRRLAREGLSMRARSARDG
jgi:hypothetical protein